MSIFQNFWKAKTIDMVLNKDFDFELKLDLHSAEVEVDIIRRLRQLYY